MNIQQITLEDDYVALLPMSQEHIPLLYLAGQNDNIWQWTTSNYCKTPELTKDWVNSCLENLQNKKQLPFVIFDKQKQAVIGSTSYLNISVEHKCIEIGYTFLNPSAQRTHVNRRCKLLLLTYAFESLKCHRVALQTHEKNIASRTAILGIGAKFEGVHRHCRVQHDGSIRSSAFFSIIKPEWSDAKATLINKINKTY